MIYLLPNTAGQSMYMTLKERAKDTPSFSRYLIIFENQLSFTKYSFIANVDVENDRYTKILISTATDAATSGNIQITETGLFNYTVYGQNSTTNLDPSNTVGVIEKGTLKVVTQEEYYSTPDITIADNIIYYED